MTTQTESSTCYVVTYRDQKDDAIVELKVKNITDSSLGLSFICLSGFLFERSSVLINPEEENKQKRFAGMNYLHLSIYSVISIAEMGIHSEHLQFEKDRSNLVVLNNNSEQRP